MPPVKRSEALDVWGSWLPPTAPRDPAARARHRRRHASSPMSRSRSPRASSSASSARTAPARRRSSTCSRGCYRPTAGSRAATAATSRTTPPYRRARAGLGRTFQVSSVFPLLTVGENVAARRGGRPRRDAADLARAARPRGGRAGERALGRVGLRARERWPAGARPRRQAQARARHGARRRPARDPARRADGRGEHRGRRRAGRADRVGAQQEGKTVLMVEHHIAVVTGSPSGSRSCTTAPARRRHARGRHRQRGGPGRVPRGAL